MTAQCGGFPPKLIGRTQPTRNVKFLQGGQCEGQVETAVAKKAELRGESDQKGIEDFEAKQKGVPHRPISEKTP